MKNTIKKMIKAIAGICALAAVFAMSDNTGGTALAMSVVAGVAGGVPLAAVGLRLRDARTQQRAVRQPAHQYAPNQVRRDAEHVAPEVFPIMQFHVSQLSYWTT